MLGTGNQDKDSVFGFYGIYIFLDLYIPGRSNSLPSWVPDWKHRWAYSSTAPITPPNELNAEGASPFFRSIASFGHLKTLVASYCSHMFWIFQSHL
jgi:hypothetical protein